MNTLFLLCLFTLLLLTNATILDKIKEYINKVKEIKAKTKSTSATSREAASKSHVPIIDIGSFFNGTKEERERVAMQIGGAAEDIGFFVVTNHGVPDHIIEDMWRETTNFFDTDVEEKSKLSKPQDEYPFGYTGFKGEVLSAGKAAEKGDNSGGAPPDLKEMFSLGPADPKAGFPERLWPDNEKFSSAWTNYYDTLAELAANILRAFAISLKLPSEDYFDQFIGHHASALRAINYPHVDEEPVPGQLRASAHTDYGTITILKADAPGLQVSKDKDPPSWIDVPYVEGAFIINLGDLMKRWTNDRWLSTLHQVVNPDHGDSCWSGGSTRRQSVAFFHNLDKDAVVENLMPEQALYDPIVAGDFLMKKHLATQGIVTD
jgi:isopenicillin N synthase-like dioxygenase